MIRSARALHDFGVDQEQGLRWLVLARRIEHHQTLQDPDLHGRETDAGRVVHGLHHVIEDVSNGRVDLRDRRRRHAELRIGKRDDAADGHDGL